METTTADTVREPWNKGKLVGQKTPFKLKEIWAIRIRLQIAHRCRDLALFNLAVDSKLRACDLMTLRVRDVCHGQIIASRALVLQRRLAQIQLWDVRARAFRRFVQASLLPSHFYRLALLSAILSGDDTKVAHARSAIQFSYDAL